jgi:MoaA/NifB/PqqE/SkfB family radical SAM enzyme
MSPIRVRETLEERLVYYNGLIPATYPGIFPNDFVLQPQDWILSSNVVNRPFVKAKINEEWKMIRPIGTMDVELLSNHIVERAKAGKVDLVKNYPCGLKCPGCFSEEAIYGDATNLMKWQEVMAVLDEAQKIGLTSVKFLGPGEMFQNPDLFDILDAFEARKLPISIFTKGAELGDDALAQRSFGHLGIITAKQLVQKIAKYSIVRILLGFNSFFTQRQDSYVGSLPGNSTYSFNDGVFENRGISGYTPKRNNALVNLVEEGFNAPGKGQRLTLIMAPLYSIQVDEVAEMYEWAARRNMPVVITPTMESGEKSLRLRAVNKATDPENNWIKEALFKVYSRAIEIGILSIDQVETEGVSPYFGSKGCNQVANGLMMRLNGQIKICPGSSRPEHIYGNIHNNSLAEIWIKSPNYALGPMMNNWCLAKREGLPKKMQKETLEQLKAQYASK